MPRLTINLTDPTHWALKAAATRQGRSMGALIEESLASKGSVSADSAWEIVTQARSSAGLSDEEAIAIAVRETRLHRAGKGD